MENKIDVKTEKAKYQAQLNGFVWQLQTLDKQRALLVQAIAERQGIIAFLNSLDQHQESGAEKPDQEGTDG